jgi:hypothetical protein
LKNDALMVFADDIQRLHRDKNQDNDKTNNYHSLHEFTPACRFAGAANSGIDHVLCQG